MRFKRLHIAWILAWTTAGCGLSFLPGPDAPTFVHVYPTGQEQRVVAAHVQPQGDAQTGRGYANCLDHAFSVLLERAYPQPDPRGLARSTVEGLCEGYRRQTGAELPSAQREVWIWSAIRTESFADALAGIETAQPPAKDPAALLNDALRGMLDAAGPRSAQLYTGTVAETFRKMQTQPSARREAGMVGVTTDRWPRVEVMPFGPAQEAGLRDGDVVVRIGDRDVSDIGGEAAARLLAGPAGAALRMTVRRGEHTLAFDVVRGSRAALSVQVRVPGRGICYVRIPTFSGSGIADRVRGLAHRARTAGVRIFLLDVRDNNGGRPEEANGVADIFLDDEVLQTFSFRVGRRAIFRSFSGAVDADVIVLTNRATASAAELLAMALRDNDAGIIVGEDTCGSLFGKDFEELDNGSIIFFRAGLTILSPTGEDYAVTGIPPDVAVVDDRQGTQDPIYERAFRIAEKRIERIYAKAQP